MPKKIEKAGTPRNYPLVLCQTDEFVELESKLSGAILVENTSDSLFLIPKGWSAKGSLTATNEWKMFPRQKYARPQEWLIEDTDKWAQAQNAGEFLHLVNQWLDDPKKIERLRKTQSLPRIAELFICLWRHGCVVWPRESGPFGNLIARSDSPAWSDAAAIIEQAVAAFASETSKTTAKRTNCFARFILTRTPPVTICDICPGARRELSERENAMMRSVFTGILALQKEQLPAAEPYALDDFFPLMNQPLSRTDPEFKWAVQDRRELEAWRLEATEFIEQSHASRRTTLLAMNQWFEYLIKNPSVPANPVSLFDKNRMIGIKQLPAEIDYQTKVNTIISKFLTHVFRKHCGIEDDHGRKYYPAALDLSDLIPSSPRKSKAYETHRQPMPTRYINLCARILSENNFAWAKRKTTQGGDWFKWRNPVTGKIEETWSPVRCYLLMLKLILPARTFQIRMLDSGEADTERYDPTTGWSLNKSALAPKTSRSSLRKGVFRKYIRKDGVPGALIFFNTNKTADIGVVPEKRGYVMAWERPEAMQILASLRDWQENHNPLIAPTAWKDVQDLKLRDEAELERGGDACFLFRDPTERSRPDLPISAGKLQQLWMKLMEELENRLNATGDRMPDGSAIRIIMNRSKIGAPKKALFDLHSLRVTIITALYEQGVPAETIMKVVGHASVLMTLHYVKLRSEDINETLNAAALRIQEKEQSNWIGYLASQERSELHSLTATNHRSAIDSFAKSGGTGLVTMDHGFCPLGARRCSDGLATKHPATGQETYGPVPEGPANCVSCRFFVTGPAFVGGLQAHFNDLSYRLKERSARFQNAQQTFDDLANRRNIAIHNQTVFNENRQLTKAEAAFERATAEADALALRMHATFRLVENCLKIINAHPRSDGFSLVLKKGGTRRMEAMIAETSELNQLQSICESAGFYEMVESDAPNLRRMRLFDQMLEEAGHPGRFYLIKDEKAARQAADEMAQFIFARDRNEVIDALSSGEKTLRDLGLDQFTSLENLSSDVSSTSFQQTSESGGDDNAGRPT